MRTIKELPVPQDTDIAKFPFGQIKNQTPTEEGTPVVREIYGDLLVNIYKILQDVGIAPTEIEDSEVTGYQFLKALKIFANELNDLEQLMFLDGNVWRVNFNIGSLPDRYVFIARAPENYIAGTNYEFTGSDDVSYPFTSATGFRGTDELLIVIDHNTVRAYSLSSNAAADGVFPAFGNPVPFNDTTTLYYESEGQLFTDAPAIYNLQQAIRVAAGNSTLYVNEILILQGHALCFVYNDTDVTYRFFKFALSDLATPIVMSIIGADVAVGTDYKPYVYTDGEFIYMTNAGGTTVDDYEINKYSFDNLEITFIQTISINDGFVKSTNVAIKGGFLYTFINGLLTKYSLATGQPTIIGQFNTLIGIIFRLQAEIYYTNGEVAKKWNV